MPAPMMTASKSGFDDVWGLLLVACNVDNGDHSTLCASLNATLCGYLSL
jgi:hypothetical protein